MLALSAGGLIWLLLAGRIGAPGVVLCVIIGVWLAAGAIDKIRTRLRCTWRKRETAASAVTAPIYPMVAVFDKVIQHITPHEWYQLKRSIRAEGREERIAQRAVFLILGVLVVIFACWMWSGEDDPHGLAGALWMGVFAVVVLRIAITYGDDPKDY